MGPLLYLTLCSLRNRIRLRLRRLKEPRYLIGTVVGLAYFWFLFGRRRTPGPSGMSSPDGGAFLAFELLGAALLFLLCAAAWIPSGRKRPALFFSQSDVQFLFTAPLSRQELVRYKLLRSQTGVLFGSIFMTLIFHPLSLASSWMFFAGMALAMTVLNLHLTGVSLRRESLGSHGGSAIARQWLPLAIVIGAVAIIAGTIVWDWQTLSTLASGSDFMAELGRLASSGAAGVVLWPFRAVARLPLSGTPSEFLHALPWVLLIVALNYVWVIRSDASFEEASAELAEKFALIRKGQRLSTPKPRASTSAPFQLALEGRAEMAIFWKNLISLGRYASLRTLLRFVPIFVLVVMFTGGRGARGAGTAFAGFAVTVFVLTILLGPQLARSDLRQDLANLDVLRSWPLDGATLVRGEVMAPAALLTVIAWLSALVAVAFATSIKIEPSWILAAIMLAPGMILLQLLMQNAIAVMWPSWVMTGANRARGIDVMGQRILMMLGLVLVLIVAVLPAGIVAGLTGVGVYLITGKITVIVPAMAAAIVLFAEAFVASHAVGKLLDRTDVSAVDAQEM